MQCEQYELGAVKKKKQYELLVAVVMENKRREQAVVEEYREKIPKLRREFVKEKPELERADQTRADEIREIRESIGKRGKE